MSDIEEFLLVGGIFLVAGGFLSLWCLICLAERVDRLAKEINRLKEVRELVMGTEEEEGLVGQQKELLFMVDMLNDCQDQVESQLYGYTEDKQGLVQRFEELWNRVYWHTPFMRPLPVEGGPPVGTCYGEHLTEALNRKQMAEYGLAPEEIEKVVLGGSDCCTGVKREERCIDGQCNPSACDREQCPHRTQEFQPYTGLLGGFAAEWDQVQQQGQVELPMESAAVESLSERLRVAERFYGPVRVDTATGRVVRITGTESESPQTQPPTKGS